MRVAIIGGAGFIGRSVAHALSSQNIEVRILDTTSRLESLQQDGLPYQTEIFKYPDVQGAERLLEGTDVVIHLACTTEPASSMESLVYDATTNIVPSLKIFRAAEEAGVRRVIFASSGGTVYGYPKTLPVTEDHPTKPMCAYGVSKLAIENYLAVYKNIEGISLRPGNPYGSYQLRGTTIGLIANFLSAVSENRNLEVWGDGSVVRDYLYIDDLADAFVTAVTHDALGPGSYNIGSGKGWSINEIIEKIFSITGREVQVNHLASRGYDVPKIILDTEKFRSETGWMAGTSLEEGILKLWEKLL